MIWRNDEFWTSYASPILVEDEGVGMVAHDGEPGLHGSGFGLFSIREAMLPIDGSVEIESTPGKGTRAVVTVPLEVHLNPTDGGFGLEVQHEAQQLRLGQDTLGDLEGHPHIRALLLELAHDGAHEIEDTTEGRRQSGQNTGQNDHRDAIANATLGDLLAEPHNESSSGC